MILCDFYDLDNDEFYSKFFEIVVAGNIELINEILQHPKLSKQFDVSYNNSYCIIASIINSQHINDCHLDLLKLFTQSPLLKKHANPSLCTQADIFGGSLGNAIIFTPIETVRFIGKYFNDKTSNLQDLIALSVFNNKKEAFFYLVSERKFIIKNPEMLIKALVNFPQVDSDIVDFIKKLHNENSTSSSTVKNHLPMKKNFKEKISQEKNIKNKPVNSSSVLLNISSDNLGHKQNYWGSKFRQNF